METPTVGWGRMSIERLLVLGDDWSRIEAISGVKEVQFEELKQRLRKMAD